MTKTLLRAVASAALALTLVGCAVDGSYPEGGSLAYDYDYGPWDGSYGYWGPGFYDGGYHHQWDDWHDGHFAPHAGPAFGHPMPGGMRVAGLHAGGFGGGFHGGGFHGGGGHGRG